MRVAFAVVTVAASWFLVQLIFALHYAHDYYALLKGKRAAACCSPAASRPTTGTSCTSR